MTAEKPSAEEKLDTDDEDDGSSDRMALDEGKMGKLEGGHAHHHASRGPPHRGSDGSPGGDKLGHGDLDDTLSKLATRQLATLDDKDATKEPGSDAAAIARVVQQHQAEIRRCYQDVIDHHPGTGGKLVVDFSAGPDGVVTKVEVGGDAALASMRACVRAVFTKLRFPARDKGWTARFPLIFNHL